MFTLNTAGRIGLNVALLLAGVAALRFGEPVFVPIFISLLLATVLGPAAVWLHEKCKLPWSLACISAIIGLVLANMLIVAVFSASVIRLANQFSKEEDVVQRYIEFRTKLENLSPFELD